MLPAHGWRLGFALTMLAIDAPAFDPEGLLNPGKIFPD